jgi:small subunit ribosomal protein S8
MSMSDPIADMLTRIRNGQSAGRKVVTMPSSTLKAAVSRVLQEEGFLDQCEVSNNESKSTLSLTLRYFKGHPVISNLQRVSRPGKRMYCRSSDIPSVNNGLGVIVVSTSKGVMTGQKAKASGTGGELICTVS